MKTVDVSDLDEEDQLKPATITDCHYVASYNWLNKKVPTIVVPGTHENT